jgi:hypothetical protein
MHQDAYLAPPNERWIFQKLTAWFAARVRQDHLTEDGRRTLIRLIFALQRFPRRTRGVSASVEWTDGEVACKVSASEESVTIERGHTCLVYSVGHHMLFDLSRVLYGEDRSMLLEEWIPIFVAVADPDEALICRDHWTGTRSMSRL